MSQIDPTTVDVEDVIRRIQAIRRGEDVPPVPIEELRAALMAQRQRFATPTVNPETGEAKTPQRKTAAKVQLKIDLSGL